MNRNQNSLVDVFSAVGDDRIHQELFAGLVAKSGDEECIRVVWIDHARVLWEEDRRRMSPDVGKNGLRTNSDSDVPKSRVDARRPTTAGYTNANDR